MKNWKNYLIVILGNLLLAISVSYFVLPYDILSAGVAGIAIILRALFNCDTTLVIDLLVIGFFIMGYFFLGRDFTIKTALSSVVYPVFITILGKIPVHIEADKLLIAIFGGAIAGLGIGMVIKVGASTGGTDIPPMIIHKYTGWPIALLIGIMDGILVLGGLIAYSVQDVMIGLVYIIISNSIIDKVVVPRAGAVKLLIISEKYEEICLYIHDRLDRGTTILEGRGGYTGTNRPVVMTVVSLAQYNMLSEELAGIDPEAFVIVSDARDVKGEGFSYFLV